MGRDDDFLYFAMAWVRQHDRYVDEYSADPKAQCVSPESADSCRGSGEDR